MNQLSEQHVSDVVVPLPSRARVVPFERPPSELQRAVQERAQERIERDKQRPRIGPLRIGITLGIALIPVLMLVGALDVAVRGFHLIISLYSPEPAAGQASAPAPEAPPQPGVVIIIPPPTTSSDSAAAPSH